MLGIYLKKVIIYLLETVVIKKYVVFNLPIVFPYLQKNIQNKETCS